MEEDFGPQDKTGSRGVYGKGASELPLKQMPWKPSAGPSYTSGPVIIAGPRPRTEECGRGGPAAPVLSEDTLTPAPPQTGHWLSL